MSMNLGYSRPHQSLIYIEMLNLCSQLMFPSLKEKKIKSVIKELKK